MKDSVGRELLKMRRKGHRKVKGIESVVSQALELVACGMKPYRVGRRKA